MIIFLTGGAGFIGSHFAVKLLKAGHKVVCIDNFDPFYDRKVKENNLAKFNNLPGFHFIEGDIRNVNTLNEIFNNNQIDIVAHFAAKAGVRSSLNDPQGYFDVNVNGTINILEQMRKYDVKKMIFASSSSVYGNNSKFPFSESDNVDNPISPYAASKKAGELICSTYNSLYKIDIAAFRFFTVYGPGQRPEMAIAKFANRILSDEPIELYDGDGSTTRDYTYIDDIIDGLFGGINKISGFEIYNLGKSHVVKLIDLVQILEKKLGKKAKITFSNKQPGDVDKTFADISKAASNLGYNPSTSIENGIEKYCQWLKNIL